MKRHSQGSLGKDETDSGGVLTEKWVVPDAPPPTPRSVVLTILQLLDW